MDASGRGPVRPGWEQLAHGRPATAGRWEHLFADLEGLVEREDRAEFDAEMADRVRVESGRIRLVDRFRAAVGHRVTLGLLAQHMATGVVRDVGPDWLLLAESQAREVLVPLSAVGTVRGLGDLSAVPGSEGRVLAKLDLRYALRRLARDRVALTAILATGAAVHGTCDRVGADFVEIAEHAAGEPRRPRAVREVTAVPIGALVLMRPS